VHAVLIRIPQVEVERALQTRPIFWGACVGRGNLKSHLSSEARCGRIVLKVRRAQTFFVVLIKESKRHTLFKISSYSCGRRLKSMLRLGEDVYRNFTQARGHSGFGRVHRSLLSWLIQVKYYKDGGRRVRIWPSVHEKCESLIAARYRADLALEKNVYR
jgi:hypothetical protein